MLLHVKAVGDGRFPRYDASGTAPPGAYAGRARAPDFAPLPEGELVDDVAETRRAIIVGDLALVAEHPDGYALPAAPAAPAAPAEARAQNATALASAEFVVADGLVLEHPRTNLADREVR